MIENDEKVGSVAGADGAAHVRDDIPERRSPLTAHDRYFRYVFQQSEPARDLVVNVLRHGPGKWRVATELSEALNFDGAHDSQVADIHRFRYFLFDVELSLSDHFVSGPVAKTALQAMYAASRKLGREGLLEMVSSLTQRSLPAGFRDTTLKYLAEGRTDNVESILATLKERKYTDLGDSMISYNEKARREGKVEGKAEGKAEGLAEALIRMLERKFTLDSAELDRVRKVNDVAKFQAALDEIIEPHATAESVLEKLQ